MWPEIDHFVITLPGGFFENAENWGGPLLGTVEPRNVTSCGFGEPNDVLPG
jgi:hypothetical protein